MEILRKVIKFTWLFIFVLIVGGIMIRRVKHINILSGEYELKRFNCIKIEKDTIVILKPNLTYVVLDKKNNIIILKSRWKLGFERDAGFYYPRLKFVPNYIIHSNEIVSVSNVDCKVEPEPF